MTTEEFRTRAANCLRWAQEAVNERTKELWLNMAQIWLDRAENPHWIQISQEDHAGRQLILHFGRLQCGDKTVIDDALDGS